MRGIIRQYLIHNRAFFILLITALSLGIVLGCCCFDRIGDEAELKEFLGSIFIGLSQPELFSLSELFQQSCLQTILIAATLFFSGLSLIGIGTVPFLIWYKGFCAGFTAMVFYRLYGVKVIPFVLLGIMPPALLWIPFLLIGALESVKTSVYLLECCCRNRSHKRFRQVFLQFCAVMIVSTIGLLLSGVVEVYLVPKLLRLISNLYV